MHICDPLSSKSHHRFNHEFIDTYYSKEDRTLIVYCSEPPNRFQSFLNHVLAFRNGKRLGGQLLLLSFDTPVLCIVRIIPFLRVRKLVVVVHNNYEWAQKSPIRSFLFKKVLQNVKIIVLASYMKDLIESDYPTLDIEVLNHPVTKPDYVESYSNTDAGYVYGRGLSPADIELVKPYVNKHSIMLCNSKNTALNTSGIIYGYIDNFEDVLATASAVYFPQEKMLRVSGIMHQLMTRSSLDMYVRDGGVLAYLQKRKQRIGDVACNIKAL